uniref:Uncharacterized protein n=1 Tax=Globodera rostochiensis TaxID=31243 RepID=A0A914IAV1_GLORO
MPKSVPRLCSSVFKNVSPLHHSAAFASDSPSPSSSSPAAAALPLNEVKRKYSAEIDQLSASITEFCSGSFERNRELHARVRPVVAELERAVCDAGGRSRLALIGSIPSGMAIDASADIDLAFLYTGGSKEQRERFLNDFWAKTSNGFVRIFMEAIAEALTNFCDAHPSSDYRLSKPPAVIVQTTAPVIICRMDNGLNMDIQFPRADFQAVRNTLMVRYYVQTDRRFLQLFHWLRRMFQQMGLKNSKNGLFSSYHVLMLVLHFLNRKEVPNNVLPALVQFPAHVRDQLFAPNVSDIVRRLEEPPSLERFPFWRNKCSKSVGELAVELVDYYALFDPQKRAISIRFGRLQHRQRKYGPWLNVFDPFHPKSVTRSCLHAEALVLGFQFLRDQMTEGKHLATFPLLNGLAEEFGEHARQRGIRWTKSLNAHVDVHTPLDDFEQSPEEQEEDGEEMDEEVNDDDDDFKQSLEEQGAGKVEGEVNHDKFKQSGGLRRRRR